MTLDFDATKITINYTGGSLAMVIGNAKSLFGDDYNDITGTPEAVNSTVSGHSRTRVIGGSSSNVSSHSRQYNQWPTSNANNAAAGKVIYMAWEGSEGDWVARMTGSCAALSDFLASSSPKIVRFTTSRGTKYGPFIKESSNDN